MLIIYFLLSIPGFADEVPAEQIKSAIEVSPIEAIAEASFVVQLTLLILVGLSIYCWAISFFKYKKFKNAKIENEKFSSLFENAKSLETIFLKVSDFPESTWARIFKSGYLEIKRLSDSQNSKDGTNLFSGMDNLERTLNKEVERQVGSMESRLSILATTGSTGPFIGLFGTVWGIMGAFQKIGATQMASLAIVAPGISEALIATAIGLAAAIPATVAFNYFVTIIKEEEMELNNFAADFLNIAERNFFSGDRS